jgi:hypothetical protein
MKPRPELLDANSPPGIEVVQLTDEDVPSSHVYMEAQVFAPDSSRFILHRSAHPHGSDRHDPEHRYLVCEVEDGSLRPITTETGATAPSVSPDGRVLYYFINETELGAGRLTLKRVGMDGTDRRTLTILDAPLPGANFRPSRIYPLSTISSDGRRLATACFLGDGRTDRAPFGLIVFHLDADDVRLVLQGDTWCNLHPQYSRSLDAEASRDILVQENHGCEYDPTGSTTRLTGGTGADIHVIRDDGSNFRDLPWGRDGNERCQGHQCWRGRTDRAITSTGTKRPPECQLIEGRPAPHAGHVGIATPGGIRSDLSRSFENPQFCHFGVDISARRLITDCKPDSIWLAELPDTDGGPARRWTYLCRSGSSWAKGAHVHPFLSPDGATGFFNSDESGTLQAYMIRGLDTVAEEP